MSELVRDKMMRSARELDPTDSAGDEAGAVDADDLPAEAEEALATTFASRHARDLRYVEAWGRWYVWDGARWREDKTRYVVSLIRTVCRTAAAAEKVRKVAVAICRASTVSGVERLAKADRRLAATIEEWDTDPWLLNTPAGTVDLRTGVTRDHRRGDLITRITAVAAGGEAKLWRAFLDRITGGDRDLQAFLQIVAGYCISGSTRENIFFFLYGTGANGKSVFIALLVYLMGDYAKTVPMETFLMAYGERHPTELANLRGARLVTANETEEGKRWNESLLKRVTGGEQISARFMRQDLWEFTPECKILLSGNHKPSLRTVDEAISRRIVLIPFAVTIPAEERDKNLLDKLKAEAGGILAWLIEGATLWARSGIALPEAVRAATAEYLADEDLMERWLQECCFVAKDASARVLDLFNSWKAFCDQNGEHPGSTRRFGQKLLERRERFTRFLHPYLRQSCFRGLTVRADEPGGEAGV